jgi:hypothetical protein
MLAANAGDSGLRSLCSGLVGQIPTNLITSNIIGIGVGRDNTSVNSPLYFWSNRLGGVGNEQKVLIDTNLFPPLDDTTLYQTIIEAAPNALSIKVSLENVKTGSVVSHTFTDSNFLPVNTLFMNTRLQCQVATGVTVVRVKSLSITYQY